MLCRYMFNRNLVVSVPVSNHDYLTRYRLDLIPSFQRLTSIKNAYVFTVPIQSGINDQKQLFLETFPSLWKDQLVRATRRNPDLAQQMEFRENECFNRFCRILRMGIHQVPRFILMRNLSFTKEQLNFR